jgi:preprotein translocase subunit SecE
MGRLLRKRSPDKKKKKKEEAESPAIPSAIEPAEPGKTSAVAVKAREDVNKTAAVQRLAASAGRIIGVTTSDSFFGRGVQFLREVKIELKKVTWPSRKQTLGSTAVVIVLVIVISFFLGLVDLGLSSLIGAALK